MNFEFFEKVPTAANSDRISENPERGFDLFRSLCNCFKFGRDRLSGCRDMNSDEAVSE